MKICYTSRLKVCNKLIHNANKNLEMAVTKKLLNSLIKGLCVYFMLNLTCSTVLGRETEEQLLDIQKKIQSNQGLYPVLMDIFMKENEALYYYDNPELKVELSNLIEIYLRNVGNSIDKNIKAINNLYEKNDFRWIAIYLKALLAKDKKLQNLFEINPDMNKISSYAFLNGRHVVQSPVLFVNNVDDIFKNGSSMLVYVPDEKSKRLFLEFQKFSDNHIIDYIDNSFDLAGRYSLVRKGLVKKLYYDKGIVAKRDNPEKEGRFLNEQKTIIKLRKILKLQTQNEFLILKKEGDSELRLKLLSPFAVFSSPSSKIFYSLSFLQPGKTLEELLVAARTSEERKKYLKDARIVLDFLYENGIIWGDMAPRNILVEENSNVISYTILDFEKTMILDQSISGIEREEHGRGPMYVEEFGAICPEQEIVDVFYPYFKPDQWSLVSADKIPLKKPKREVISILESRGIKKINFGIYNAMEKEIMKVRFPQIDGAESMRYPLSISFRVDHYLGNKHDLMTTEILLAARKYDLLFPTMDLLEKYLQKLENSYVIVEFENAILGLGSSLEHKNNEELTTLAKIIDGLYANRHSARAFEKIWGCSKQGNTLAS